METSYVTPVTGYEEILYLEQENDGYVDAKCGIGGVFYMIQKTHPRRYRLHNLETIVTMRRIYID